MNIVQLRRRQRRIIKVVRIRGSEAQPLTISNVEAKEQAIIYEKNQDVNKD